MSEGTKKKQSQDISVSIGERPVVLRFGLRAVLALKDKWNLETDEELRLRLQKGNSQDVVDLMWACCLTHQRDITWDEVLDFLDDGDGDQIQQALKDILEASAPPENPTQTGKT